MPKREHRKTVSQKESELDRLIREQRVDMKMGSYQRSEWFVSMSLDALGGESGEWSLQNVVSDGDFRMPINKDWYGCPLHGRGAMVFAEGSNGGVRCSTCYQEQQRMRYRTDKAYREKKKAYAKMYRQSRMTREQKDRANARRRERRRLMRERPGTAAEDGA